MKVRLGCLSCPFPCLSVAIFTDLNYGDVLPTPVLCVLGSEVLSND